MFTAERALPQSVLRLVIFVSATLRCGPKTTQRRKPAPSNCELPYSLIAPLTKLPLANVLRFDPSSRPYRLPAVGIDDHRILTAGLAGLEINGGV
jgi:hypothetical protein